MKLNVESFYGKNVRIIDTSGHEWTGFVCSYQGAPDYEPAEQCVELQRDGHSLLLDVMVSDIKSIEVIDS